MTRAGGERGAWWEAQLAGLSETLRESLRRRVPGLAQLHGDIVNDTLVALAERLRGDRTALPASWFTPAGPGEGEGDGARTYFIKLAMLILRRRVADVFRHRAREWGRADSTDAPDAPVLADEAAPSADRQALLARMLRVCVGVLADLTDEDRDLLLQSAGLATPREGALSDRERQRLKRARARLTEEITRQLGAEAAVLLRED